MKRIPTHSFLVEDAIEYGIEKALIIKHLRWSIEKHWASRKHFYKHTDGKNYCWTYASIKSLAEIYPYMNEKSISRWMLELENDGVILSNNFNRNKYDKTKWFTLKDCENTDGLTDPFPDDFTYEESINDTPKMSDSICQNEESFSRNEATIPYVFNLSPLHRGSLPIEKEEAKEKTTKVPETEISDETENPKTFEAFMESKGYQKDSMVDDSGNTYEFFVDENGNKLKNATTSVLKRQYDRSVAQRGKDSMALILSGKKPYAKDEFNYRNELVRMAQSKVLIEKIIALVWDRMGITFENAEQMQSAFIRDSKWAVQLKGYSSKQVQNAIELCKEEAERLGYEWKISTVVKKITSKKINQSDE